MNLKAAKIIAISAIGLFNVGAMVLSHAANKHAKAGAKQQAIEARDALAKEAFENAEKRCDIFKDISAKEKAEFEKRVRDWRVTAEFDARKNDILDSIRTGLEEFKGKIGYYNDCDSIEDEFDAAVEAFKNSIDYDGEKAKLEELIAEAKKHYESQKALFDAAGDETSDIAMKLRHAEEEAMTNKIKDAKGKLEALEKQVKDEVEKLQKTKLGKLRGLEEKVSKEKIRLDKKTNKDLDKLNDELSEAEENIMKAIRKNRNDEAKAAFASHEDDVRLIREQREADTKIADQFYSEMPGSLKIARYLADHKVPKFVAGFAASLPLIPVGYLVFRYGAFVRDILKEM